ncbi:tyrosine-type recombinase/integrase [Arthrobacter sp. ISL-72]|uniref:tyrosine-type recombinase/integrase n=1 Tax=Arthrobacter sp. ISL-72 TaxID=2819114 RepID=UPI00203513DA|nr:tyrosine-type recombinase/integrase [Arthrobacter sp. ISL-72]
MRLKLLEGQIGLPGIGAVRRNATGLLPYAVVDEAEREIEVFSLFLGDLVLTDMSPLTVRSYGNDLLRWWRVLQLIGVPWDKADRLEVEVLVGWMRSAVNPQRRQNGTRLMNPRTGKRPLAEGYAPATINHALAVLASFYAFHARFGRGPVMNPVPESPGRRARLAHRSPMEETPALRRAPLRQKAALLAPRSIPDQLVDELIGALRSSRDRALVCLYLSSGARASELLGVHSDQVDWAGQRVWVISKGSRALEPVPASPESLQYLAAYFHEHGTPGPGELIWRALHGTPRPLNYHAARRILQRANAVLGTDWSLHDLRHTTIDRMVSDPKLTLPEVMAVTRHRRVSSLAPYLRPRIDEVFEKVQEHFAAPRPEPTLTPGYDADDFSVVFGG